MKIEKAADIIDEMIGRDFTLYRRYLRRGNRTIDEYELFYGYDMDELIHIVGDSWEEVIEKLKEKKC